MGLWHEKWAEGVVKNQACQLGVTEERGDRLRNYENTWLRHAWREEG